MRLHDLPSVDELARSSDDPLAVDAARRVIDRAREEIRGGADPGDLRARLVDDLGSGALVPLPDEPSVRDALGAGADLVCFSGDKLLGGPQAGIVVGRADLVERLRRHPLQRALRADKLTIAALEGTLGLYLDPERTANEVPVLRMLHEPAESVRARAERLAVGDLDASGVSPFEGSFGADFWSWLKAHPEERAIFDRAMEQGKERRAKGFAPVAWRGDETVVDVGGGNGSLLVELLKTQAILRTIRDAARPDSRLLILDQIVPPGNEAGGGKWLDLLMLALLAGKERSEVQWRDLLAAGGFEPVRFHEALIEAVPA